MSHFKMNLNRLYYSIQEMGLKDIKVEKKAHQVIIEAVTDSNIAIKLRMHETCLAQTSPAAWSYCANPNDELWIQRVSFLQNIPEHLEEIIKNKRFDSNYLQSIVEKKEDEDKEEDTSEEDSDKKEGHKYEYGCLLVLLDPEEFKTDFIEEDDLYYAPNEPKEQYGREDEPHISILFGFKQDEMDMKELDKFVDKLKPIKDVTITGISIFEQEDYDVVKYEIESETLHEYNKEVKENFPYFTKYPDYNPHITIAYVKSGKGKKYVEKYEEPKEVEPITEIKYSFPSGKSKKYTLESEDEE